MGNVKSNGNLQWNNDSGLCCKNNDMFDKYSFGHLTAGIIYSNVAIVVYSLIYDTCSLTIPTMLKICSILLILHGIFDLFENLEIDGKVYSVEKLLGAIYNCKHFGSDNDTLQNYIGDNISFAIGALMFIALAHYSKFKYILSPIGLVSILVVYLVIVFFVCKYVPEPESSE